MRIKKAPEKNQELFVCAPTEIRTPVLALKGLRPSPLDDGGGVKLGDFTTRPQRGQAQFQGSRLNGWSVVSPWFAVWGAR